jgi:hypothetical protein
VRQGPVIQAEPCKNVIFLLPTTKKFILKNVLKLYFWKYGVLYLVLGLKSNFAI